MSDDIKPAFVSVVEASKLLGVHSNTLRAACKRGEFPHLRIGRAIRISTAILEEIERTGNFNPTGETDQ